MALPPRKIYQNSGLGPIMGGKLRKNYQGMVESQGQEPANQMLAKRLGFNYKPNGKLNAVQQAKFQALRGQDPSAASAFRHGIIQRNRQQPGEQAPGTETPAPDTTGTEQPIPTTTPQPTPEEQAAIEAAQANFRKMLFPTQDNSYDYTANASYQNQATELDRRLGALMRARGLTGSDAENRATSQAYNDLLANETQRQDALRQAEAARALQAQMFDTTSGMQAGQNQFNNQMALINAMLGQNPLGYAYNAAQNSAELLGNQTNALAGLAGQFSYGGGGGGGGSLPVAPPDYQYPGSPGNFGGGIADVYGTGATGMNISSILGSLFG